MVVVVQPTVRKGHDRSNVLLYLLQTLISQTYYIYVVETILQAFDIRSVPFRTHEISCTNMYVF